MADQTITEKLRSVQMELNAPKGQRNSFGNYDYRSAEDILEAVKPLLEKHGLTLLLSDTVVQLGERYYVKAEASVTTGEDVVLVTAYAREAEDKKGMDAAQVTGSSSSYARKYALNGLFAIDDAKDPDTNEHRKQTSNRSAGTTIDPSDLALLRSLMEADNINEAAIDMKLKTLDSDAAVKSAIKAMQKKLGGGQS